MNCRQFRKHVVELLDLEPGSERQALLREHLEKCPRCGREYEELNETLAALRPSRRVAASPDFKESVMSRIARLPIEAADARPASFGRHIWKTAAATVLVAGLLTAALVAISSRPSGQAYAIEQTIKANRGVRSIHIRMTPPRFDSVAETWAQFDENGDLEQLRMNFPDTEDGPKDVVWSDGKATVWFKKKGSVLVVKDENVLRTIRLSYDFFDPKLLVEKLYHRSGDDAVAIAIAGPDTADAPIVITVTEKGVPDRRSEYTVDPQTKLLQRHDVYQLQGDRYELATSTEYLEYNQPINPDMFELQAPQDAVRIDQTVGEVGLAQGDLTDEEVAVKVVHEFFGALIAKDYAKAGQLLEGMPADRMKELFGRINFVRIVWVGHPTPYERNQSLRVPCKIEIESGGQTSVFEPKGPFVRQVHGQSGRWTICGGI